MNPDQGNFFLFRILNFMADELFRDYCMIKIDMIEIIERKKKNHKKKSPLNICSCETSALGARTNCNKNHTQIYMYQRHVFLYREL